MSAIAARSNSSEQQGGHSHHHGQQSDLYMKIVCDPGHERTIRELRELPRESRERVWADMGGAAAAASAQQASASSSEEESSSSQNSPLEEQDPNQVRKLLDSMESELEEAGEESEIWQLALQTTKLAHDPQFRLMFLRSEEYDPSRAAIRMVRHFENKAALWGTHKLNDQIRLQDMSSDDLESLSCGGFQFLPVADRCGRLVFMSRYRCFVYKQRENMLRALWYMMMSVLDNPNTQNIGLVVVGYEVGEYVPVDNELTRQMFRMCRGLPLRYVSSHSCYSESPMQKVMDLVVHMVSTFTRLRFRIHHGSHQECRYRLLTMGIPVDYLPVSMNGVLSTENHKHWLQYRIQEEQQQQQVQVQASSSLPRHQQQRPPSSSMMNVVEEDDADDMAM